MQKFVTHRNTGVSATLYMFDAQKTKIVFFFFKDEDWKVNRGLRLVCIVHLISVLRRLLKSAALGKR